MGQEIEETTSLIMIPLRNLAPSTSVRLIAQSENRSSARLNIVPTWTEQGCKDPAQHGLSVPGRSAPWHWTPPMTNTQTF